MIRVLVVVSQQVHVDGSSEFLYRERSVSRTIKIIKDLLNFILRNQKSFDFAEEFRELLDVELAAAVLISDSHPVHGNLLNIINCDFLRVDLSVDEFKDVFLLLFLNFVCLRNNWVFIGFTFFFSNVFNVLFLEVGDLPHRLLDRLFLECKHKSSVHINIVKLGCNLV